MARTTNSDTLPHVESRYELGMVASQRVRDLNGGAEPIVEKKNDKMTVVALREIATGDLNVDVLRHELVQSYKESPVTNDGGEASLEIKSEDPLLREIDAELENALIEEPISAEQAAEVEEISADEVESEDDTTEVE